MKHFVRALLLTVILVGGGAVNTVAMDIPLPTCGSGDNPCPDDGPTPFYPPVPACALIPPYCTMP